MRTGPGKPGRAAEAFLLARLAGEVVVPVGQLVAEAEQKGIVPATLYRAAKRLGVTKPVCWALPAEQSVPQQVIVEAEEQAVAAVAEIDRRVERAAAEVKKLTAQGLDRDIAIYRRVCQGDPELAALVLEELAR